MTAGMPPARPSAMMARASPFKEARTCSLSTALVCWKRTKTMMPAAMTNRATVQATTRNVVVAARRVSTPGNVVLSCSAGGLAAKAIVEVAAGGSGWAIAIPDHVAGAAHGVQQRPLEAFVDLGAQPRDVDVDNIGLRVEVVVPHVLEQH